jgi:hypothetical protein
MKMAGSFMGQAARLSIGNPEQGSDLAAFGQGAGWSTLCEPIRNPQNPSGGVDSMPYSLVRFLGLFLVLLCIPAMAADRSAPQASAIAVNLSTTLPTQGSHIRQFAFDGDADTFFESARDAAHDDHFTLVFEKPVLVKSITAQTGEPQGSNALEKGVLEVSEDGKTFHKLADFKKGRVDARVRGKEPLAALQITVAKDQKHPLAIREIVIESEPGVAIFQYPVEFIVDVTGSSEMPDSHEMKEWADHTASICEKAYPMISEELKSDGFRPPSLVTMSLNDRYKGVAATGGTHITGSIKYFQNHLSDVGAMVHETVHVVQQYHSRNNPGWLVEGVADYVRFFMFEPGKLGPINPERAHYNGSYRVTAAFLAYLTEKYDKDTVPKLNRIMRAGQYQEDVFKQLTGKTVQELDEEWRSTLSR